MRAALILSGIVVTGLGIGCLNYTTAGNVEHHREWALEHGVPGPGRSIYLLGLACTVGGSGMIGWALGRRLRK